jgi:putative ABC transport system permease protein
MVYLWYEMLIHHPWFGKFLNIQEKDMMDINMVRILFVLFLLFATIYQISIRRGNITPDTLDDVSLKQMKWVIFWENVLFGFSTLVTGIILGLLISPLIFPIFAVLMETPSFPFLFPSRAIGITVALFFSAFVVSSLCLALFLYPKRKARKSFGRFQSYIWIIVSIILLLLLYLSFHFFGKPAWYSVSFFYLVLGFFFILCVASLVWMDKKIEFVSILSNQTIFSGLTGKIIVSFLAVIFLVSSIGEMKVFLTSYQTQKAYYKENAFTFYLEALYKDKSKLGEYERLLEQELTKKRVSFQKQTVNFLILKESNGTRFPLAISYSQYAKLTKQVGRALPSKLKENEAVYFFTAVNAFYHQKSEIEKNTIAFQGYPTAFHLQSNIGSFIPGYDVIVLSDEVYKEIASIRTAKVDYTIPDRYVLYTVPAWMKNSPTYASAELEVGTKLINLIEGSPLYKSDQDHILNGYTGNNENYELTVRSPYGMGVNDLRFVILALFKCLLALILMLFLYNPSKKLWGVSFYFPYGVAILSSFLFSMDRFSIIWIAIGLQLVIFHIFFFLLSKKRFTFHR